jgi:hypothetical protein
VVVSPRTSVIGVTPGRSGILDAAVKQGKGQKECAEIVYATFCHIEVAAAANKENSFAPRTHLARSFNGGRPCWRIC